MERIIAPCGNNCSVCPRYMPKSEAELHNTAILWNKIGYRDDIVPNDEIQCFGCTPHNFCRYKIIDCVTEKGADNCGVCAEYPCEKISAAFEQTKAFDPACKACCTEQEYELIKEAFFKKKENLDGSSIAAKII